MRANSLLIYVIIHFHEWHFFHNFVSYLKPSKCILRRYSPFQSYGLPPFRSLLRATLSRLKTLLKASKTIVNTVNSRHSSMFQALISSPEPRTSSALPIVMAHQVHRVSTVRASQAMSISAWTSHLGGQVATSGNRDYLLIRMEFRWEISCFSVQENTISVMSALYVRSGMTGISSSFIPAASMEWP